MSRRLPRRLAVALAAVATVFIAACGSSGGNAGNGDVGTGGHDSPENATRGFINALAGFNGSADSFKPVLDWLNPSSRPAVQQGITGLAAQNNGGSFKFYFQSVNVGSASVSSDGIHASVPVGGNLCFASSSSGGAATSSCSSGNSTGANAVKCIKEGGQWYIDGNTFGGGGSGGSGGDSSSSASSSDSPSSSSSSSSS